MIDFWMAGTIVNMYRLLHYVEALRCFRNLSDVT